MLLVSESLDLSKTGLSGTLPAGLVSLKSLGKLSFLKIVLVIVSMTSFGFVVRRQVSHGTEIISSSKTISWVI
jgi:hypothetical protein